VGAAVIAAAMSVILLRRRRPKPTTSDPVDISESTGEQPVLVGAGVR